MYGSQYGLDMYWHFSRKYQRNLTSRDIVNKKFPKWRVGLSFTQYFMVEVEAPTEEMAIDPQLALNHISGISKVVLYAGSNDRYKVIDRIQKAIKEGNLKMLRGTEVKRYD